jgi:molecular chaperone HtpG
MSMAMERGNLSINSENIFPIIKKWMYSDQDIFVREMVSNATDAITKRKKLDAIGEAQLPDGYKPEIHVIADDKEKTLTFIDNGIGMTAEEVKKDITEIAFSGATEFLEKYKDKADQDQIIGHFGLGFYSAFMVAEQVDIDTLSFQEDATPVHWECDGSTDYEMGEGDRKEPGTTITLHLTEDCLQYANEYKVREILEKYCAFMPVPIYLEKADAEPQYETIDESELREDDEVIEHITVPAKTEEHEDENGNKEVVETEPEKKQVKIKKRPVPVNDTNPLWAKQPGECTDEEYKEFYRHVFLDYKEPLFWIHLNMDYPFNLKGILYFPRLNTEYDRIEGVMKLYNNQVFVADNIKEVIPEYLMLLKGVIDCPDFPLNVSRSALQNDGFVKKISDYIAKKVADKLSGMCKNDRETYEKYWDDLAPFIKYGCIRDEKFNDRMKNFVLFKNLDDRYLTLADCIKENQKASEEEASDQADDSEEKREDASASSEEESDASDQEDDSSAKEGDASAKEGDASSEEGSKEEEEPTTIYYVTDPIQQSQYINLFRSQGKDAVLLNHVIDNNYITFVEGSEKTVRFQRIDAEVGEDMKEKGVSLEEETKTLQEIFRKALSNDQLKVSAEQLRDESISAMVTLSEQGRRMAEMMKLYGMSQDQIEGMKEVTLVLNAKHPVVRFILEHKDDEEKIKPFCEQLFDLAMIANGPLMPEQMTEFVRRTNKMMLELAEA